jgi:hypothetical protein
MLGLGMAAGDPGSCGTSLQKRTFKQQSLDCRRPENRGTMSYTQNLPLVLAIMLVALGLI